MICLCNGRWFRSSWVYILMRNKFTCAANVSLWSICFFIDSFLSESHWMVEFFSGDSMEAPLRFRFFRALTGNNVLQCGIKVAGTCMKTDVILKLRHNSGIQPFKPRVRFCGPSLKGRFGKCSLPNLRQRALRDLTRQCPSELFFFFKSPFNMYLDVWLHLS